MQEMIEVIIGYRHTVVPKSNEPMIRQVLAGSPDEKKLIIVPYPPKSISKEKEQEIIKKLEPVAPAATSASIPEPEPPSYIINNTNIDLPGAPAKKNPEPKKRGRPKRKP